MQCTVHLGIKFSFGKYTHNRLNYSYQIKYVENVSYYFKHTETLSHRKCSNQCLWDERHPSRQCVGVTVAQSSFFYRDLWQFILGQFKRYYSNDLKFTASIMPFC